MTQVEARVPTTSGGKYVQQLCKHWSHKLPVEIEGDTGVVTFDGAVATMKADAEAIDVIVRGEDREQVDRLKDVVAQHLDRFAFREAPMTYEWAWK
ncbi:hypothetical protein HNO88_002374 [Novosphingobium chloroacetimidivorans]|uniref:DUF2218 domain-containing protein n=1 Tax=Novosphingobium chloroacetimidivorans TaxID=1428314 RepID=A0A7W7KBC8_9SPHN|nr:DUF2218 domain-containing protein [Novosphingobium chloroacetimidivorans]MBB4859048.1 hypothetical protein [Novosphingobium chloroacetimidivorans]